MAKSPDAFRTISEVAEWLETPAHVLRFWETRFPQVRPVKRAGGRRYYRPGDIALLSGIKKLLHEDGMTIRGVQKLLREQGIRHVAALGAGAPGQAAGDTGETERRAPAAPGRTATPLTPARHGNDAEDAPDAPSFADEAPMIVDAPQDMPPAPAADNVVALRQGAGKRASDRPESGGWMQGDLFGAPPETGDRPAPGPAPESQGAPAEAAPVPESPVSPHQPPADSIESAASDAAPGPVPDADIAPRPVTQIRALDAGALASRIEALQVVVLRLEKLRDAMAARVRNLQR